MIRILLMAVAITIGLSPESQAVLARWAEAPQRIADALDQGIEQWLVAAENNVKIGHLSGSAGSGGGGSLPVGLRSGDLRQDVTHARLDGLQGYVGTTARTADYAPTILGPDTVTIKPTSKDHLWVPIADNLGSSLQTKYSPKELYDTFGKDRIRIFKSKAGNLVVFVEDRNESGGRERYKRNTKAGHKKGELKGRLMFVLKDEVVVHGTDALAVGTQETIGTGQDILNAKLLEALS